MFWSSHAAPLLGAPPMAMCCLEEPRECAALGLQDGALQLYALEAGADGTCAPLLKHALHGDVVSKLQYAPSLAGFVSSSWDRTLKIFSVEREKAIQTFGGAAGHQKAVFSFDWCDELQLLGAWRRVGLLALERPRHP